jgi:hypothetical protein
MLRIIINNDLYLVCKAFILKQPVYNSLPYVSIHPPKLMTAYKVATRRCPNLATLSLFFFFFIDSERH